MTSASPVLPFYVGTYTSGNSQGIYRSTLELTTGRLTPPMLVAEVANPMFLALHPALPVLYSASEVRRDGKREASQVKSFRLHPGGQLSEFGHQPSGGVGPCYLWADRLGRSVMVANYSSGSVSTFPLTADGALKPMASRVQHQGKSIHPSRQEGPHAHCIMTDPSSGYVCAVDLGLDQVLVYALDATGSSLNQSSVRFFATPPGAGPRHLAFHPSGLFAFLILELNSTLSALSWNAHSGRFVHLHTVPTLPAEFPSDIENLTAEVLVHPNGRFVYGSNRGHDSIVAFAFAADNGTLNLIGHWHTLGKTPRNFRLDPSGNYLLAANQDSNSIVVFKIDQQSGELTPVAEPVEVGSPCCIKFLNT